MTAATYSANVVARMVAKATNRPCDGKRVRSWARGNIGRFDDDGYTTHAYTLAERDRIVKALVARSNARATGTPARASSASRGRSGTPKATRKRASAPKSAPKPSAAPEPSTDGAA